MASEPMLPPLIVLCLLLVTLGGLAVIVYGLAFLFDALSSGENGRHDRHESKL